MDNENLEIKDDVVEETTESTYDDSFENEEVKEETEMEVDEEVTSEADEDTIEALNIEVSEAEKPEKEYLIKNKIVREIVSWTLTIVVAIVIAIIINTYIFRISRVSGQSMEQTYLLLQYSTYCIVLHKNFRTSSIFVYYNTPQ